METVDIGPCDESAFEAIDYKSCKNILFQGHAFVGEDKFNCSNNEIVEIDLLMEKLDISDEEDLNDLHVKKTICSSISDNKTSQFSTELKDLSKCAAILCSEALQSCPSTFAKEELSVIELGNESSVDVSNPPEDSLVHHHDSSKLTSALKGSRAQGGKPLNPNLRVTWAANVYDPPVTSSSHTVKKHRYQLPKAKPSDNHHKHKHMKAKPSNASSADRKHSHRRVSSSSILDTRMARMQVLARRSVQADFGLSKIQQASGQDSVKCGGSIHSESPWPLPHPIAEAS